MQRQIDKPPFDITNITPKIVWCLELFNILD